MFFAVFGELATATRRRTQFLGDEEPHLSRGEPEVGFLLQAGNEFSESHFSTRLVSNTGKVKRASETGSRTPLP